MSSFTEVVREILKPLTGRSQDLAYTKDEEGVNQYHDNMISEAMKKIQSEIAKRIDKVPIYLDGEVTVDEIKKELEL